jgi:hypothetical protein
MFLPDIETTYTDLRATTASEALARMLAYKS